MKKPQENRTQTEALLIRFEPDHLKLVEDAADYLGLPKSTWIRATMLREAREVLKQRGNGAAA